MIPDTAISDEQAGTNMVSCPVTANGSGELLAARIETDAQKKSLRTEIKPLTTLRFFAAFAVVVNHASDSFSCWHGLNNCFIVGQAVTFFFVLSGFILTYNYFNLNGVKSALRFYVARIARIWPAHLCTLFLLLLLIPEVFKLKSADLPLFFCNLFLLQSWIPSWHVFFSYNASAWSISTEMFFYLCFPIMLWCLNKKWYLPLAISSAVLVSLICLATAMHLPEYDPVHLSTQGLLYINPLSSIFNFCIGMTAAVLWRDHLQKISLNVVLATVLEIALLVGVCAINVSSSSMRYLLSPWVGDACAYWAQNSGPSVLGFALLISIFAMNRGWVSRLFCNSALVLLGELSFGIYMLHGVLITFMGVNFPQEQSMQACLCFLIILFVSAHLMFELVEKPMRSFMIKGGNAFVNFAAGKFFGTMGEFANKVPEMVPVHASGKVSDMLSDRVSGKDSVSGKMSDKSSGKDSGTVSGKVSDKSSGKDSVSGKVSDKSSGKDSGTVSTKGSDKDFGKVSDNASDKNSGKFSDNDSGKFNSGSVASSGSNANSRKRVFLAIETAAFFAFVYFSVPTINHISDSEASAITARASVTNVQLPPLLVCKAASSQLAANQLKSEFVWESTRAQNVNYSIRITALSRSGEELASTTYTEDGRRQSVKAGALWLDRSVLSVNAKTAPTSIAVTVLRNKHEVLHASANDKFSFSVPVIAAVP